MHLDRLRRLGGAAAVGFGLLLTARTGQALPLISEVFYDAVGSDNGLSFIEIAGLPGTVLDGLVLEGINGGDGQSTGTITLVGAIPASGLFVVADESTAGATAVPGASLIRNFDLQNGPDSLLLRSASVVLDAVGYGVFAPGEIFAGEGAPAVDPAAGASIARRFADVDTGDNAADFVALATPTPGAAPFAAIPEPSPLWLLAVGLLSLTGLRRPGVVSTRGPARR